MRTPDTSAGKEPRIATENLFIPHLEFPDKIQVCQAASIVQLFFFTSFEIIDPVGICSEIIKYKTNRMANICYSKSLAKPPKILLI